MRMTRRRMEFLQAIRQKYQETGEPVHYDDVARWLGVSKWTAYDMVQELSRQGQLAITYATNRQGGQVGRSRLAIVPIAQEMAPETGASGEVSAPGEDETGEPETTSSGVDVAELKERINHLLDQAAAADSKAKYCAAVVAAVVFVAQRLVRKGVLGGFLESVLAVSQPEVGVALAVGAVVGYLMRSGLGSDTAGRLEEAVTCFQQYLGEITEDERNKLAAYVQATLNGQEPPRLEY